MERISEILVGNFGFDLKLAFFSIINFFVVFLILKKLIFNKLENSISERKKTIEEGLRNFELSKDKLEKVTAESKIIIDDAKLEAAKIIEDSYKKAEVVAESVKINALKEIDVMMEKAKQESKNIESEMRTELRKETVNLVIEVTEKILGEKIDPQIDRQIVEKSMSTLNANFKK
ncbi:F0F1 ATP synthase subunit B [Candidatus Dojkabacteria bacterium]|nr:F0F1 ATP synthase subunit B [Candidatus Dojkabacteria bacterium]